MPLITREQIAQKRAQAFLLRGEPATYRKVVQATNTKTGAISETYTDTAIEVLVGNSRKVEGYDRVFRVKSSQVAHPAKGARILYMGNEYIIHSYISDDTDYCWDIFTRKP